MSIVLASGWPRSGNVVTTPMLLIKSAVATAARDSASASRGHASNTAASPMHEPTTERSGLEEAIARRGVTGPAVLERAKGLEPSTPTLARSCSTTELHPHPKALTAVMHRQPQSYAKCALRMQQFADRRPTAKSPLSGPFAGKIAGNSDKTCSLMFRSGHFRGTWRAKRGLQRFE